MSRFIPAIPVIHAPTYAPRNCDHVLLLSMIVLGSVFMGEEGSTAKVSRQSFTSVADHLNDKQFQEEALWRLGHAVIASSVGPGE